MERLVAIAKAMLCSPLDDAIAHSKAVRRLLTSSPLTLPVQTEKIYLDRGGSYTVYSSGMVVAQEVAK